MAKARTVKYTFDPFELLGITAPENQVEKVSRLKEAADFVKESIRDYCENQTSPVQGHGQFKRLTKDYAVKKLKAGQPPIPNLILDDEMLNAIQTGVSGSKITIKVTGKQGAKADGHCDHSGESRIPLRRFIPLEDESFKAPIMNGVKRILRGDE